MKSIVSQTLSNMNYKNILKFSVHLNTSRLCFLFFTGMISGLMTDFSFSFEDVKFMFILLAGTAFFVFRDFKERSRFSKIFIMILLGLFTSFSFNDAEPRPSLWARSTETTLTQAKVDSLIKSHQQTAKAVENKKEINPKVTASILFLLLSLVGLGSIYMTAVATMVSVVMFFFFLALGIFALAGAVYFLHRIFRKEPFKKRLERTKADNKRESKIYFKIVKMTLLFILIVGLLALGGLFFY